MSATPNSWKEKPSPDAFWRWSGEQYALPGMSAHLLALQDTYGCDVNLLLLFLYFGQQMAQLEQKKIDDLMNVSQAEQKKLTIIRSLRQSFKGNDGYEKAKEVELKAEKLAQKALLTVLPQQLLGAFSAEEALEIYCRDKNVSEAKITKLVALSSQ